VPKSVAVLVSIITIVRNDSPGLSRTRASIAAQVGMSDFEWVVVDGASTDGTAQLALGLDEAYASSVSQPDKGIFDAMNKGLERAAGTFVVFLNAGDAFANAGVLARVSRDLSANTVDFLYGDSLEAFAGDRLRYKVAQGHGRVHYGMFACHQAMYYNKRRGRAENWVVQRDVLRLSLPRRLTIRGAYLASALLSGRFPQFYKMLRFRESYGY